MRELFQRLVSDGHRIYIWSGMGERWGVVRRFDLASLVSGVYEKPTFDHRWRLDELGVPVVPDFVVDDHEEVVEAFGGFLIRRFFYGGGVHADEPNDELDRLYRAISEFAST